MNAKPASPDKVSEQYAQKGAKLTVRLLDDEFVLLEGDANGLEFLGTLLLAYAQGKGNGHSGQLGPKSAGNAFFTPESTKGIYIHRLPCAEASHPSPKSKG